MTYTRQTLDVLTDHGLTHSDPVLDERAISPSHMRDAYRALVNAPAKVSNPSALGREVLRHRVGVLLDGMGL